MFIKRLARFASSASKGFDRFQSLKAEKLNDKDLSDQLANLKLDDWKYDRKQGRLSKKVCTKDMKNKSNELLQSVNVYAQRIGAKPDYVTGYDYVEISVFSPDLNGVSQKDVGLASAISRLEKRHREYCLEPKSGYRCELKEDEESEIYTAVSGRADSSNKGYGQSSGQAIKDQPKGPSYSGSASGLKQDPKTAPDGFDSNVAAKSADQSGAESHYGKGFKTDQGVKKEGKSPVKEGQSPVKEQDEVKSQEAREQDQKLNARQNQDHDKKFNSKSSDDQNEFPHGQKDDGNKKGQSNSGKTIAGPRGSQQKGKEEPKGKFARDRPTKNAHEDKDRYLNEKSAK